MKKNTSQQTTKDMLGRSELVSVDVAQHLLLDHILTPVADEQIPLDLALDRVLSQDINATDNLPAHPRSTMDGYAVIAADTFGATESMPGYLQISGEVKMGELPSGGVQRGQCFRIATGGLIPTGADSVVMFEHTVPVDDSLIEVVKSVGQGANIIHTGDDISINQLALPAGSHLRPQDLGLLAGLGISEVRVHRKVRIGILSTGDEIVPYQSTPPPGKIRNINGLTLASQAKRLGAEVSDYGIVADEEQYFFPAVKKAVSENDLVIFSGGSSVGARDLGEKVIESLGNPGVIVHGVTLKPGKPILIGIHNQKPLFGLPGHPVSAMVCFDLFVAKAIEKLSGRDNTDNHPSAYVEAQLKKNIHSAPGRKDIVRIELNISDNTLFATPVLGKSGSISTLSRSHGYLIVEEPVQGITENSTVKVYLYK